MYYFNRTIYKYLFIFIYLLLTEVKDVLIQAGFQCCSVSVWGNVTRDLKWTGFTWGSRGKLPVRGLLLLKPISSILLGLVPVLQSKSCHRPNKLWQLQLQLLVVAEAWVWRRLLSLQSIQDHTVIPLCASRCHSQWISLQAYELMSWLEQGLDDKWATCVWKLLWLHFLLWSWPVLFPLQAGSQWWEGRAG